MLLRLNLLLLMAAAFLPFPTGVLAQALKASDSAERAAIVFYGATALVIELLLQAAVRYAESRPELAVTAAPDAPPRSPGARLARGGELRALRARDPRRHLHLPQGRGHGYLAVAIRGVIVVGGEGRLGLSSSLMGR